MALLLLSLAVLLPACHGYVREDFFQNHVQNFLNHSISPCHDFYDHVCSVNRSEIKVEAYMKESLEKFLAPYMNPIYTKMVKMIEEDEKKTTTTFESPTKMKEEIRATCEKNFTRCEQILAILQAVGDTGSIPDGISLGEVTDWIFNKTNDKIYNNITFLEDFVSSRFYKIGPAEAAYRALEKNENFRNDYVAAVKMASDMLDKLKEIMVRNFENTKWMQDHHVVKYYQELVRGMSQIMFFNPETQKILATVFESTLPKYKECSDIIFGWHPIEIKLCIRYVLNDKLTLILQMEGTLDVQTLNAYYLPNYIGVLLQALFMFAKDRISQLATIGYILGHEISHGIYEDAKSKLLPQNLNCIMEHRRQICSISNYTCYMGNTTITEDAPDITGLAAILDLFEEEAKSGKLNGNPQNISEMQFFFYVNTAFWCKEKFDHEMRRGVPDKHSPPKGRMNALLMHSEKFQEAFNCQKGDRMWREPDNFCHLLGPDANRR